MLAGAERFAKRIVLRSRSTPTLIGTLHPGESLARQIKPMRIEGLDESNLLRSPPTLQLLLTADRLMHNVKRFPVEQALDFVFVGEPFDPMKFVLESSCMELAGHPDVERSRQATYDVDVVCLSLAMHGESKGPSTAVPRSLRKQAPSLRMTR